MIAFFKIYAIVLLVFSLMGAIHSAVRFINEPRKDVVRLPWFCELVGIVGAVIVGIILWGIISQGDEVSWLLSVLALIGCVGEILLLASFRTIRFDRQGFTVRRFPFFLPRRYEYREITAVRDDFLLLYVGKCRIGLNEIDSNCWEFLQQANQVYRKFHKVSIPLVEKKFSIDPFRGNVDHPAGFVLAYILVSVCIIGMGAMIFLGAKPPNQEELICQTVTFTHYEVEDGEINYYVEGDDRPYRSNVSADNADFIRLAQGDQAVQILVDEREKANVLYSMIGEDGRVYIAYEEVIHEETVSWYFLLGMVGLFAAVWGWFIFRSIQVGRNPQNYSLNTINLYFRRGTVWTGGR